MTEPPTDNLQWAALQTAHDFAATLQTVNKLHKTNTTSLRNP